MRSVFLALGLLGALALPGGPAPARAVPSRAVAPTPLLACGQIRCQSNADCPANCGPCVTWSGTCALFGPR